MPRRNQPARRRAAAASERPAGGGSSERVETWRGVDYRVRSISGSSGVSYRCPGCDQMLPAHTPHIVAWTADDPEASDRRHWHTACWAARNRRAPVVERSRNAPRYG